MTVKTKAHGTITDSTRVEKKVFFEFLYNIINRDLCEERGLPEQWVAVRCFKRDFFSLLARGGPPTRWSNFVFVLSFKKAYFN